MMEHAFAYYRKVYSGLQSYTSALKKIEKLLKKYDVTVTTKDISKNDFYTHISQCRKLLKQLKSLLENKDFLEKGEEMKGSLSMSQKEEIQDIIKSLSDNAKEIINGFTTIVKGGILDSQSQYLIRDIVSKNCTFTNRKSKMALGKKFNLFESVTHTFDFSSSYPVLNDDTHNYGDVSFRINPVKGLLRVDGKSNALIDLLNIPTEKVSLFVYKNNETDCFEKSSYDILANRIEQYHKKYGPLFNYKFSYSYDLNTAYEIINRIKVTYKLKQALSPKNNESERDLYEIFLYAFYLLVSPEIHISMENEITNELSVYKTKSLFIFDELFELFCSKKIEASEYNEFIYDSNNHNRGYALLFCKYLKKIDVKDVPKLSSDTITVYQFLKEYLDKIGIITELTDMAYYAENAYLSKLNNMESSLIRVAKSILNDELNYHLNRISLEWSEYDSEIKWKVENLIDALYLSIANFNNDVYIVKTCKYCGNSFFDYKYNEKKEYCTDRCGAKDRQYRNKNKFGTIKNKQYEDIIPTVFDSNEEFDMDFETDVFSD